MGGEGRAGGSWRVRRVRGGEGRGGGEGGGGVGGKEVRGREGERRRRSMGEVLVSKSTSQ